MGEITEFWNDRVTFDCHRTFAPDVVICATGYRTGLEPLVGHLGVLNEIGLPKHPKGEAVPGVPGLWFNGFRPEFQGYFHSAQKGAHRIARGILSQERSPLRLQPSPRPKLAA